MNLLTKLAILAGLGGAAWWAVSSSPDLSLEVDALTGGGSVIDPSKYTGLPNYIAWQPTIAAAAAQYGLPDGLLDRLLYQESGYTDANINGDHIGPAGDAGIAQFIPSTAASFGIDPLDPSQAIPAAALYLSQLYGRFGDWGYAVAAYNDGQGNVHSWLNGGKTLPGSTVAYVARVVGVDLPASMTA